MSSTGKYNTDNDPNYFYRRAMLHYLFTLLAQKALALDIKSVVTAATVQLKKSGQALNQWLSPEDKATVQNMAGQYDLSGVVPAAKIWITTDVAKFLAPPEVSKPTPGVTPTP
jgi:hypothetical protein